VLEWRCFIAPLHRLLFLLLHLLSGVLKCAHEEATCVLAGFNISVLPGCGGCTGDHDNQTFDLLRHFNKHRVSADVIIAFAVGLLAVHGDS
jgi:hypothetical protein